MLLAPPPHPTPPHPTLPSPYHKHIINVPSKTCTVAEYREYATPKPRECFMCLTLSLNSPGGINSRSIIWPRRTLPFLFKSAAPLPHGIHNPDASSPTFVFDWKSISHRQEFLLIMFICSSLQLMEVMFCFSREHTARPFSMFLLFQPNTCLHLGISKRSV